MSIRNMRIGDTLVDTEMRPHEVTEVEHNLVRARDERTGRIKTFDAEKIFNVDHNDGLWQETLT